MFDLTTFKVLGRIPAAEDADAIIYDPASNRVFTFNGDAHSSTVIDPRAGTLVTNIPLGGKPEYGASPGDGKVYANLTDTSEVVEIDARAATVSRRWSTAPCAQPVSMAIDTAHHRLFSGCRSGVMAVSDYQAGRVLTTVPIGTGVDGAGFDPGDRRRVRVKRGRHPHGDSSGLARTPTTWSRPCRRQTDRGTWDSMRSVIESSSPRRGLAMRRAARPGAVAGGRSCRDRSRCS